MRWRAPAPTGAAAPLAAGSGSIIVVLATDAPLLPHQCDRLAQRAGLGIARMGGVAANSSGDLFVAFATGNRGLPGPSSTSGDGVPPVRDVRMLDDNRITPLFQAAVESVEEAIVNALLTATTMTGADGITAHGLDGERVVEIMARHGRGPKARHGLRRDWARGARWATLSRHRGSRVRDARDLLQLWLGERGGPQVLRRVRNEARPRLPVVRGPERAWHQVLRRVRRAADRCRGRRDPPAGRRAAPRRRRRALGDAAAAAAPEAGLATERRLVSVLFADLVGFTALAASRDAEAVRELLTRYFETSRQTIERYGGTVEKFIGDAVMAVWGAPVAQEDDAERAVRAGLELVAQRP